MSLPTLAPAHVDATPTDAEVAEAAANIRGRTVAEIVQSAASGLDETNPRSLAALIVALSARFDAKAARREAKAAKVA
jgi:hypothetical protein